MDAEESDILERFKFLAASCEKLTDAHELIIYAKGLCNEIIEIQKRLAAINGNTSVNTEVNLQDTIFHNFTPNQDTNSFADELK